MEEPILTKKQVAERLGVSPRTITNLNLPHATVGGQNRYLWSEVSAAIGFGGPTVRETQLASEIKALSRQIEAVEEELARLTKVIEQREGQ